MAGNVEIINQEYRLKCLYIIVFESFLTLKAKYQEKKESASSPREKLP